MYKWRLRSYLPQRLAGEKIRRWILWHWHNRPRNSIDPISQQAPQAPLFKHVSSTGYVTVFTAPLLVDYFVSSGNFQHPETRVSFLTCELMRLQRVSKTYVNLVQNRELLEIRRHERLIQQGLIDFFENDVCGRIVSLIEPAEYYRDINPVNVMQWYITTGFPSVRAYVEQMVGVDRDAVSVILTNMVEFCNKSIQTGRYHHGLCSMVSAFLTSLGLEEEDMEV